MYANFDLTKLAINVAHICEQAGDRIMRYYNIASHVNIYKKIDDSPVTDADLAANRVITDGLRAITPDIPILSEEDDLPSYNVRQSWERYWLVDPLDGTEEFITQTGEFTVNIALIVKGHPVLGVVYIPTLSTSYIGVLGQGAWKTSPGSQQQIRCSDIGSPVKVLTSRRPEDQKLNPLIQRINSSIGTVRPLSVGSSIKFCMVAEGKADLYLRLSAISEWDCAAAQAILTSAGGTVITLDGTPLQYNRQDSIRTPPFIALTNTNSQARKSVVKLWIQHSNQALAVEEPLS